MSVSTAFDTSLTPSHSVAASKTDITAASPTTGVASSPERTAKRIRTQKTYYAVKKGRDVSSCIFLCWDACRDQVEGCESAIYGAFSDWENAEAFLGISDTLSAQHYVTTFGCDMPSARQQRDDEKAKVAPASPPRKRMSALAAPSSPYSFIKSLNRTNRKRPAPTTDVVVTAPLKNSNDEMVEDGAEGSCGSDSRSIEQASVLSNLSPSRDRMCCETPLM